MTSVPIFMTLSNLWARVPSPINRLMRVIGQLVLLATTSGVVIGLVLWMLSIPPNSTPPTWIGSLIGVILGWFLGQLTSWWQSNARLLQLKTAIYAELRDSRTIIRDRIEATEHAYAKIARHGECEDFPSTVPEPIIFKSRYHEVALLLSENERLAFTHIQAQSFHVSDTIKKLHAMEFGEGDERKRRFQVVSKLLDDTYCNACLVDRMMERLLLERDQYNINATANVEILQQVQRDADKRLVTLRLEGGAKP